MATAKEKREQRERDAALHKEEVGEAVAAQDQARTDAIEKHNRKSTLRPDQVQSAHGESMRASHAGGKVIVACKLGIAYLDLQLTKLEEIWENTQTGPRRIKEARRYGPVVRIRGTAYPRGTPPIGFPEKPVIVDGAALNFDIDADFWNAWVETNRLNPLVLNKMIFAHEQRDVVSGMARELKEVSSGLDPVNPKGDNRAPRSTRGDLANIETEEARAKSMDRLNLP